MEPLRPVVDRGVLDLVRDQTFKPADFTIRKDGVCRLNPELAKCIVAHQAALLETNTLVPLCLHDRISGKRRWQALSGLQKLRSY